MSKTSSIPTPRSVLATSAAAGARSSKSSCYARRHPSRATDALQARVNLKTPAKQGDSKNRRL
jgi:hypothetical protein